jgi:16S rRNA G966 N2-methylase RsmD
VPSGALAATLAPLVQAARLGPEAIVVVEHAGRDAPPSLLGLTIERTRRYGDTAVTFYRRAEHEASDEQVESEGQA